MTTTKLVSGAALLAGLLLTTSPLRAQDEVSMDHAAMASSYDKEAKDAQDKASRHELMLNRYKGLSANPKGTAFPKELMVRHCQKLVGAYNEAASQASELAKLHRQAAQAAK